MFSHKSLQNGTFKRFFKRFSNAIESPPRLVERLSELRAVLCELDTFRFYTSSLLITYDGGNGFNSGCGTHLIPGLSKIGKKFP